MIDVEKLLQKVNIENTQIPKKVENKIQYALNNLDERKQLRKVQFKLIPAMAMVLILVTGISFATSYTIKNFFNHNKGTDTAIQYNYMLYGNGEYITANNIGIKVENLLMDDYNLNISFLIQLNKNTEILNDLKILDMTITDNEQNILYDNNSEYYMRGGSNQYIKKINGNTVTLNYNLYADCFPKSKKLNIKIEKINLQTEKGVTVEGDWEIDVDIPEKFYNRENYIYHVESCTRQDFMISGVNVYETGTKINITTEELPDLPYDINDDAETKERKRDEYYEKIKNMTVEEYKEIKANKKFKNEYIENEKGERFYPSQSTDADGGYSNTEMKYLNYWQTFTMTKFDATDKLKIYLNYKGEDVYIILKRK